MRYERVPQHDKRFARGDDYAGDAWRDIVTKEVFWVVVGRVPSSDELEALGEATDERLARRESLPAACYMRKRTKIWTALALGVLVAGCASDPQPCGRTRCPPTTSERIEREAQNETIRIVRQIVRRTTNDIIYGR
jgi:hypothetical protein